jgi:hypothetical protein
MTEEHYPWCFAWVVPDRSLGPGEQTLAAMLRAAKWLPGEAINISFWMARRSSKQRQSRRRHLG